MHDKHDRPLRGPGEPAGLLDNFLEVNPGSLSLVSETFGLLAAEVILRGGKLTIDSESVTVEVGNQTTRLTVTNGADPATAAMMRLDQERINGGDAATRADKLDTLIAAVRVLLHRESNLRE